MLLVVVLLVFVVGALFLELLNRPFEGGLVAPVVFVVLGALLPPRLLMKFSPVLAMLVVCVLLAKRFAPGRLPVLLGGFNCAPNRLVVLVFAASL